MPDEIRKRFARTSIDALGGPSEVAEIFGFDERLVSNWQRRGLPASTFYVLEPMLIKLGRDAPPVLFGQHLAVHKRVIRPPRPKPTNGKTYRKAQP